MKTKRLFIRVAFIAIFQLCFQMGISAQGWGCISLPGGSSGIDCGMLPGLTDKVTIETWVRGTTVVASNLDSLQNGVNFLYDDWTRVSSNNEFVDYHFWLDDAARNSWRHMAVVFDGKTRILYSNGVPISNTTMAASFTYSIFKDLFIGRNSWSTESGSNTKFSDYRVWNTARTTDEIFANYQKHVPATSTGLVLNYTFDEQKGDSTINLVNPTSVDNLGMFIDPTTIVYTWGQIAVVPTNLVVTDKTETGFTLSWDGSSLDQAWEVEMTDPDGGLLSKILNTKSDIVTDLGGDSYTVKVRTSPIPSAWSTPLVIDMTTTGIKNPTYNSTITNQNGMITINNLEGANDIMIYNVSGTLVKQFKSTESNYKINATNLMPGLYLFKVNNDKKQKVFKVIL